MITPMLSGLVGLIMLVVGIFFFIFWLMMLIEILTSKRLQGTDKLVWFLVVFFLYPLGAIIYYFVGRKG